MVMKTNVRTDFFQSITEDNRKILIDNSAIGIDSITTKLSSAQCLSLLISALKSNEAENILAHFCIFQLLQGLTNNIIFTMVKYLSTYKHLIIVVTAKCSI